MMSLPSRGSLRARASRGAMATLRNKLLVLGEQGCGKTTAIMYYIKQLEKDSLSSSSSNNFVHATLQHVLHDDDKHLGVDIMVPPVIYRNNVRIANCFFECGSEVKIRQELYTDFQGVLLSFSLSSSSPLHSLLDGFYGEIDAARNGAPFHCVVVGMKHGESAAGDERRENDAKKWCKSKGCGYYSLNAVSGHNVLNAFEYLIEHATHTEAKRPAFAAQATNSAQQAAPQASQQQQHRPPSSSPRSSPSHSPSPPPANLESMSVSELRKEMQRRGIDASDCIERADMVNKLKGYSVSSMAVSASSSPQLERDVVRDTELRMQQAIIDDVTRWAVGKDIRALLNDVHAVTPGQDGFLDRHCTFAPVNAQYKKAMLKIHPDKAGKVGEAAHIRATEMFKVVNSAFEAFKKVNDKRASGEMDAPINPRASGSGSTASNPYSNAGPTPRTRPPQANSTRR